MQQTPLKSVSTGRNIITCCSKRVSCIDGPGPGNQRRPSFSWSCQLHRGRLLSAGCHDEVGHLGLECMLWPHAWQVLLALHSCTCKRAHWEVSPMSCFQSQAAKSSPQKHHGQTSSRAHPPWLSVPGRDSRCQQAFDDLKKLCTMAPILAYAILRRAWMRMFWWSQTISPGMPRQYVTRTQTAQTTAKTLWDKFIVHYGLPEKILTGSRPETLRVSWWLTSVSWWGCRRYWPVHITHKPMANVRDSTPIWSTCLGPYLRRRSQSGRTTLECLFTHTTAPRIQVQGSAPTTSCMGDNLTFW